MLLFDCLINNSGGGVLMKSKFFIVFLFVIFSGFYLLSKPNHSTAEEHPVDESPQVTEVHQTPSELSRKEPIEPTLKQNNTADPTKEILLPTVASSNNTVNPLTDFKDWLLVKPSHAKKAIWEQQGLLIAKARHKKMTELIKTSPKMALEQSISFQEYARLPDSIKPYIEKPFSQRVNLLVLPNEDPASALVNENNTLIEFVGSDKYQSFQVYRYGERQQILSKDGISAQGISLNGNAVIANKPLMLVQPKDRAYIQQHFTPISTQTTDFYTGEVIQGEAVLALAGGKIFQFSSVANMEKLNVKLSLLEKKVHPQVGSQLLFKAMLRSDLSTNAALSFEEQVDILTSPTRLAKEDWTTSVKKVFFIRVAVSDNSNPVQSKASLLTALNNASDVLKEISHNKTYLQNSVSDQVLTLSHVSDYYDGNNSGELYDEATNLFNALNTGIDLANYDIVGIYIGGTKIKAGWAGLAGGSRQWLNNSSGLTLVTHEFGHNYGLGHSNFWETNNASVIGAGSEIGYGDKFDIMGGGDAPNSHFHPQAQVKLNWMETADWIDVTSSGSYRIARFDHENATGKRALRIARAGEGYYWLGHRQKIENESLKNGLYTLWQKENSGKSMLLDTTPGSFADSKEDKNDASITIGRTYADSDKGIYITPLAKGGVEPNQWIEVQVNLGSFATNSTPSVTLVAPSNLSARIPLQFTANGTDPDGDTLAYQWDFGDGVIEENSKSINHSWIVGGEYTVKVTVSDMKGKTATEEINITVVDPMTQWSTRTSTTSNTLYDIASNGQMVLAVGKSVVGSNDGETWTQQIEKVGTNVSLYGVIYHGSQWIVVGQDYDFSLNSWVGVIYTSSDGVTWTQRSRGGPPLSKIAYGANVFIAIGDSGTILSSSDGINWSAKTSGTSTTLRDISFGNGHFVIVGGHFSGNAVVVLNSTDGNTWSDYSSGSGVADWQNLRHISYLNNTFISSGWHSKIRHSENNGQTFQSTRNNTEDTPALAFGNQIYFAAGINKKNNDADIDLVSVDGKHWTPLTTPALSNRNAAIFFNNTFITVGAKGAIRQSASITVVSSTDNDNDGMPNDWETANGLDPNNASDASSDSDQDGLTALAEYKAGTDPQKADSDNDGMPDGWELQYSLNPLDASDASTDSDKDGLTTLAEYKAGTDPQKADSDNDGMPDGWELQYSLNPLDASDADKDADNDGISNKDEYLKGSSPVVPNVKSPATPVIPVIIDYLLSS